MIEKGVELDLGVESNIVMSVNDVKNLQNAVMEKFRQITNNKDLIRRYIEALVRLKQRGVKISDRRKIKVLKVASAISFVYGENDVSLDSLAEALKLTAVHDEEDLKKVEQIILELGLSSFYQHVQKIQVVTAELQNALNASLNGGMEELKMLSTIYKKASTLMDEIPKNPRLLPYIRQFKQVYSRAEDVLERKKAELFGI